MNTSILIFLMGFLSTCQETGSSWGSSTGANLRGTWVIDSMNVTSVSIPSFCKDIGKGATFNFLDDNNFEIYKANASTPCDRYTYKIQESLLQVIKDNMIMLVNYETLSEDKMKLTSRYFFKWEQAAVSDTVNYQKLKTEGVTVFFKRIK